MLCDRCGAEIRAGEVYNHAGQNLCEDCYMEARSVPKTCDPFSVRSARITREKQGQSGLSGLLPVQKEIYTYIKSKGRVERAAVAEKFALTPQELEKHVAVLRHCELVRGTKLDNRVYLLPMQ